MPSAEKDVCERALWHGPRGGVSGGYFTCGGRLSGDTRQRCGWIATVKESAPVTPDPAEEFEALRRVGPKWSSVQVSRMRELERILDARDAHVIPPEVGER